MSRYIPRAHHRCFYIATIASGTLAPTQAEVAGGVELTTSIVTAGIDGFAWDVDRADAADLGSLYDKNIRGTKKSQKGALSFYADTSDAESIRTTLVEGTTGFIAFTNVLQTAIVTGTKIDVWTIEVADVYEMRGADKDAAKWHCGFAFPGEPKMRLSVLA